MRRADDLLWLLAGLALGDLLYLVADRLSLVDTLLRVLASCVPR